MIYYVYWLLYRLRNANVCLIFCLLVEWFFSWLLQIEFKTCNLCCFIDIMIEKRSAWWTGKPLPFTTAWCRNIRRNVYFMSSLFLYCFFFKYLAKKIKPAYRHCINNRSETLHVVDLFVLYTCCYCLHDLPYNQGSPTAPLNTRGTAIQRRNVL